MEFKMFKKIFSGLDMTKEVTTDTEQMNDTTGKKESLNDASGQVNIFDCNVMNYDAILLIYISFDSSH